MKETVISEGLRCEGTIKSESNLVIFGSIEGKIEAKECVTIEFGGEVKGEIVAQTLLVKGTFNGIANCHTVQILKGGHFIGDIKSCILIIDKKGAFEGKNEIDKNATKILKTNKKVYKEIDTENIIL